MKRRVGEKMYIGICDDEESYREIVQGKCKEFFGDRERICELILFRNGKEAIEFGGRLDILFLDIGMSGMDGLEVAKWFKDHGKKTIIILITSYKEYMAKAYKYRVFRYLLKPIDELDFVEAISEAIIEINKMKPMVIHHKFGETKVYPRDILFVTAKGDDAIIHLENDQLFTLQPLSFWCDYLGNQYFFRCHKSHLVGLDHIRVIDKNHILLRNKLEVPVSRRRKAELESELMRYIRRNAR